MIKAAGTSAGAFSFTTSLPKILSPGEQRYLILESKVGIFEEVVHEDDEFAQTALAPSALGQ